MMRAMGQTGYERTCWAQRDDVLGLQIDDELDSLYAVANECASVLDARRRKADAKRRAKREALQAQRWEEARRKMYAVRSTASRQKQIEQPAPIRVTQADGFDPICPACLLVLDTLYDQDGNETRARAGDFVACNHCNAPLRFGRDFLTLD